MPVVTVASVEEMSPKEILSDTPLPNWELIAVLPTMLSFDATSDEASQRSRKLSFALQQLNRISTVSWCSKVQKLKTELVSKRKEVKKLKATVFNEDTPLFKCTSCSKVFVNQDFLASHLKRRHSEEKTEESL
ncbi:zinc finger, C2H2 type [Cooperia oncophora]